MENQKIKSNMTMNDVYKLSEWMDIAIKRNVFTKDEIKELFPVWNKVYNITTDFKRRAEMDDILNNAPDTEIKEV
jgi:hypothetical protein